MRKQRAFSEQASPRGDLDEKRNKIHNQRLRDGSIANNFRDEGSIKSIPFEPRETYTGIKNGPGTYDYSIDCVQKKLPSFSIAQKTKIR